MNQIFKILALCAVIIVCVFAYMQFRSDDTGLPVTSDTTPIDGEKDSTIIAFGDSLTAGYDLPAQESYPAQLEARLTQKGYSVKVVNSGVSGETTRGNLERAQFIRAQNADIVILGIGGNDAIRSLPVTETKSNIEKTVRILLAGDNPPKVVLLGMQSPLNAGVAYKQSFDAIYKSVADAFAIPLVPFITQEIFFDQTNLLSDGIHLNKVGYGKVVDQYILPAVLSLLK